MTIKSTICAIVCSMLLSCDRECDSTVIHCPTEELGIGTEYIDPFKEPFSDIYPLEDHDFFYDYWLWTKNSDTLKIFSNEVNIDGSEIINMFKFLTTEKCISALTMKSYLIDEEELIIDGRNLGTIMQDVIKREFSFKLQAYSADHYVIGRADFTDGTPSKKMYVELTQDHYRENVLE